MVCRIFYTFNISIKFSFVSKAGVPSKPGIPKLLEGSKNSIQWEKADENPSHRGVKSLMMNTPLSIFILKEIAWRGY